MYRKITYSISTIAVLVAAMSFSAVAQVKLTILFHNYVGDRPLVFDSISYKNPLGQSYRVTMFKYYVGNFHFKDKGGEEYVSKGYYLVNQEEPGSMRITLDSIPNEIYTAIRFTLGVDSIDNCSGAQSGALDPINGMFWAWNSGYIFLKMEGISPVSNSNGKRLEFHIGGYREPDNCIKTIYLTLKQPINTGQTNGGVIDIKADINHLFASPNPVNFSTLSSVTGFHHARAIADNYSSMFSIMDEGK